MDWVKFYFKDYRHDTRGLDPMGHGIYRLLLDEFLQSEKPLPDDMDTLCEIAEARTAKERETVQRVLRRFWIKLEDGYIQKLAFVLITDYRNGLPVRTASANGVSGTKKQSISPTLGKRIVSDLLEKCERFAGDSQTFSYKIKSDSLASLINQESGIRNHKPRTKNQTPEGVSGRSPAEWANLIHTIYGRRDAEMEAKQSIIQAINTGTDPALIEANVRLVASHIEARAPGGWGNQLVASGRRFWTEQQWRNPEAFAQRWDDVKKKNGVPLDEAGAAPPVVLLADEPDGWRVVWPEHFDFSPPAKWLDVPVSERRMLMKATLEWQKNKAGEAMNV